MINMIIGVKKTNFYQICVKNVKVCRYCMCGTHQLTRVPPSKTVDNAARGWGKRSSSASPVCRGSVSIK